MGHEGGLKRPVSPYICIHKPSPWKEKPNKTIQKTKDDPNIKNPQNPSIFRNLRNNKVVCAPIVALYRRMACIYPSSCLVTHKRLVVIHIFFEISCFVGFAPQRSVLEHSYKKYQQRISSAKFTTWLFAATSSDGFRFEKCLPFETSEFHILMRMIRMFFLQGFLSQKFNKRWPAKMFNASKCKYRSIFTDVCMSLKNVNIHLVRCGSKSSLLYKKALDIQTPLQLDLGECPRHSPTYNGVGKFGKMF